MKKRRFKRTSWLRFFLLLVSISLLIVVFRTPILSFLQLEIKESLHRSPLTAAERIRKHAEKVDTVLFMMQQQRQKNAATRGTTKHRIYSVHTFEETFPDLNPIQLATAKVLGIPSIKNRADAELHKGKLVCIEQHTDYHVNHLTHSIPYLIPRAARLLEAIAAAYTDSLQAKGLPSYQLVVTSVLRTEEDIAKLRGVNRNASEQSCHRYGTTFDISYNQFIDTRTKKRTASIKLKSILAEVLDDFRQAHCCYIKYEAHQACFHITCR